MNTPNQRTRYSDNLQRAIDYAAQKHFGQKRHEQAGTPYIVHPVSVAWILADAGADEDTVIAGLLHDILEDVPGSSYEGLKADFGERIANLVRDVSEDKDPSVDATQHAPWLERKQKYLAHLQTADPEALKVAVADKIHNLRSMRFAYATQGESLWSSFNAPADKKLWFYDEVLKMALERLPTQSIVQQLDEELGKIRNMIEKQPQKFTVFVDDNFHYMDESERYKQGEYDTYDEAVAKCKEIVDDSLTEMYEPGMDSAGVGAKYCMFGDDPWVMPVPEGREGFSAWTYAGERAKEIVDEKKGNDNHAEPSKEPQEPLTLTGDEYIKIGEIAKPFWEKGVSENPPKFVIYMGGVGSGKTTIRRLELATGYVHFEFGEILVAIKNEFGVDNPRLNNYAVVASDMILRESIENKENIVIEVIGENKEIIDPVIGKMKDIGYEISVIFISCDPVEAYKRHVNAVKEDRDYLSAFYTQEATLSFFYQQFGLGKMPTKLVVERGSD